MRCPFCVYLAWTRVSLTLGTCGNDIACVLPCVWFLDVEDDISFSGGREYSNDFFFFLIRSRIVVDVIIVEREN